jgi:ubiquinone/menaquinone biosynthesis C-methylase UbiE
MTRLLTSLGLDVSGIDLSPGMIAVARRNYPELSFEAGELADLPFQDGRLGGVFAWYSIIHSSPEELPGVFAEFFRVLAPGGHALLSFQVGEGHRNLKRAYGHEVSMVAHLFTPEVIADHLAGAGFDVVAQLTRPARPQENTPQAVLLAHRPGPAE